MPTCAYNAYVINIYHFNHLICLSRIKTHNFFLLFFEPHKEHKNT